METYSQRPSRFEIFFRSSSTLQRSVIIAALTMLTLSPFVGLIGIQTCVLATICVGVTFYFFENNSSKIVEEKEPEVEQETLDEPEIQPLEKHQYSVQDIRRLKKKTEDAPFFMYSVIQIYQNSRSATPVAFQTRDNSANSCRHYSARSASPMIFYTAGEKMSNSRSSTPASRRSSELGSEDPVMSLSRAKSPEDLMDYYHDDPSTLPKGDLLGRIQWMHQNNGRIRAIGRVLSSRDLFFHFKDVELKSGQVLNVGDRVLFEISIYKNLVCATHIRKVESTRSKSTVNAPNYQE